MKMLRTTTRISITFIMLCTFLFSANAFAQRVIKIEGHDNMKFDVTKIAVKPGEKVTIKLVTVSKLPAAAMSHNFVLLKQSVDDKAFAMAGARHRDNDYIDPAKKNEIIAYTDLASGGETVEVTFTAPKKAGKYDYVCTFPGHYVSGMKGVLTVQ